MSLGARLLASGALGSVSGLILAAGMLALLSAPAHAQSTPLAAARQPGAPGVSVRANPDKKMKPALRGTSSPN
jgi:hypothetical protein